MPFHHQIQTSSKALGSLIRLNLSFPYRYIQMIHECRYIYLTLVHRRIHLVQEEFSRLIPQMPSSTMNNVPVSCHESGRKKIDMMVGKK